MLLTYKTRLEPNNKQHARMMQYAGAARYAYNWAIYREKEAYGSGNSFINDNELRKLFTKHKADNNWLYSISNAVTAQAIKDAVIAFSNFFKGRAKYPQFKSKKKSKPSFYQDGFKIKVSENHIKIEKIADGKKPNKRKLNWIKLSEKNRIPQAKSYLNPRITFDGMHWYVSVGVEHSDDSVRVPTNQGIGIDLGLKELAVCSDGHTYKNINKTDRVKRLETLQASNMMKNHRLAKSLSDVSLSKFNEILEYKAKYNGVSITRADRFYPSSKTCSHCGSIKSDLKLSDRTFKCNECGYTIDRDLNASINLAKLGRVPPEVTPADLAALLDDLVINNLTTSKVEQRKSYL